LHRFMLRVNTKEKSRKGTLVNPLRLYFRGLRRFNF